MKVAAIGAEALNAIEDAKIHTAEHGAFKHGVGTIAQGKVVPRRIQLTLRVNF